MYSHAIFKAIPPNLAPTQADDLLCCNRYLQDHIELIRLDLHRTCISFIRLGAGADGSYSSNSLVGESAMKYLSGVRPHTITMYGQDFNRNVDIKWIGEAKHVIVENMKNKKEFSNFVKQLNCTKFSISNSPEIDIDEVLDRMHHVEQLNISRAKVSPCFLDKLTEKTKNGSGLQNLRCIGSSNTPISVQKLLDFIKNASFSHCMMDYAVITIEEPINCSRTVFLDKLRESEFPNEIEVFANCFLITKSPTLKVGIENLIFMS